jgi:hypothetical protein
MNWAQCTLYRLQLKRVGWGPDSSHVNEIESMTLLFKGLPLHAEDDSHLFEASRLWVCMDCNVCINEIPLKRLNLAAINSEQNRFYVATGNALMVYNSLCPEQSVYPASYYRLNHPYPRFADDRFATDYSPAPFNSICSGRIFDWEVVAACDDAGQVVYVQLCAKCKFNELPML